MYNINYIKTCNVVRALYHLTKSPNYKEPLLKNSLLTCIRSYRKETSRLSLDFRENSLLKILAYTTHIDRGLVVHQNAYTIQPTFFAFPSSTCKDATHAWM